MMTKQMAKHAETQVRASVLSYKPSLSHAVYDTIFSYWRLPVRQKAAIQEKLPRIQVDQVPDVVVSVDWARFLEGLEAVTGEGVSPVQVTWAWALCAEKVFDGCVVPVIHKPSQSLWTDHVLTHATKLWDLLDLLQQERGEYYMSFLILITILERALYDLYHQYAKPSTTPDGKTPRKKNKKKNMILRDLLHSDTLNSVLPEGLMALLRILFLPSGLNIRNLVWHGFMIPAEFPRCFGCLTAILLLELPRYFKAPASSKSSESEPMFRLRWFDERFILPSQLTKRPELTSWVHKHSAAIALSGFVPKGRANLVQKALDALSQDSDEYWFLFAILPVLEHALRVEFVRANNENFEISTEYAVAQIDAYYSTLDGFGQRDKHQVLLHPEVLLDTKPDGEAPSSSTVLNSVYEMLSPAALAVFLDLFMMASGPNVRAKLCHGEADLADLLAVRGDDAKPFSIVTQMLLLAMASVCKLNDSSVSCGTKRPLEGQNESLLSTFETMVTSSFHPFNQLQRLLTTCKQQRTTFATFREQWMDFRVSLIENTADSSAEPMAVVEILRSDEMFGGGQKLTILEKVQRLAEFQVLYSELAALSAAHVKQSKTSFSTQLIGLQEQVARIQTTLADHFQVIHHAVVVSTPSSEAEAISDPDLQRYLLALTDADGLSVSSCMIEILGSIIRSLDTFQARFLALVALIREGKARTNHRRSLLNQVFFLPVFQAIQEVCLGLTEHQIIHLTEVARRKATLRVDTRPLCPLARQFEQLQKKLLQFVTAFEGCTGSSEASQKSGEKALQLASQFFQSKAIRNVLTHTK
ncbi:hypothetical protein Poli38472_007346 [Pythium oligandrum]|uniref:DUF4209 domain-containing protein n=1 Tax=Pythium oligandrum TaxID=41045 RepID=A0A8K1CA57_PYTOL|nr:hypothetical protein Poli38472_007346 [Pythium oligandrum]|eukprot:TMW59201.1 hypothetical protein Poli38472_007346 [Pythium oligandrum]